MPIPRLTVDAVLKMAHGQAHRHQHLPLAGQTDSSALRKAIGQVWELVKQRLGHSQEVRQLDAMIARMTSAPATDRRPRHAGPLNR